jgi:hypothetical protein
MTRALHDSLRGLGLDKLIEKAASDIPDARDRLDYVARLSEQAAKRVLDATDAAGPLQDAVESRSADLRFVAGIARRRMPAAPTGARWPSAPSQPRWPRTNAPATATRAELMNIMLAQDFQDLTGQVIGKITSIAQRPGKAAGAGAGRFRPERDQARTRQRPAERPADQARGQRRGGAEPGPGRRPARQPGLLKRRGGPGRPSFRGFTAAHSCITPTILFANRCSIRSSASSATNSVAAGRPGHPDAELERWSAFVAAHVNDDEDGWLLRDKQLFLDAVPAMLSTDALFALPPERTVLSLRAPPDGPTTRAAVQGCAPAASASRSAASTSSTSRALASVSPRTSRCASIRH